jgi:hypothetical protein
VTDLLAYVDESARPGRYLLAAVIVDRHAAGSLRRQVRKLLLPGQRRLHFKTEGVRRRRELIESIGGLDVEAIVYSCRLSNDVRAEGARATCLMALVRELQRRRCEAKVYIESRERLDGRDGDTIRRSRQPEPLLSFQHLLPDHDPLLWLPDSFAWSVGAGGDWLRRIGPLVTVIGVG